MFKPYCSIILTALLAGSPTPVKADGARMSYALRTVPELGLRQGFGVGIKNYSLGLDFACCKLPSYSTELSFNAVFGEKRDLYEFGMTIGKGTYWSEGKSGALEVVLGLPRMGVASEGEVMWTPQVGIEAKVGPITVTPTLNGYLGNIKGIGFGVNAGLSF